MSRQSRSHAVAGEKLPALRADAPGIPAKPRYREQYGIVIVCPDEAVQRAMFASLAALVQPHGCKLRVVCT